MKFRVKRTGVYQHWVSIDERRILRVDDDETLAPPCPEATVLTGHENDPSACPKVEWTIDFHDLDALLEFVAKLEIGSPKIVLHYEPEHYAGISWCVEIYDGWRE